MNRAHARTHLAESDPSLIPTHPSRKEKKPVLKARADFLQPRQCAQHPRLPLPNVFTYVRARNRRRAGLFFHAYISRKKLKGRAYANKISSLMNARRRKNNGAAMDKKAL